MPCWLNSGTLLGLMREGGLIDHDQDIDLSIWACDEFKLQEMLPLFKKGGYSIFRAYYKGRIFQYKFSPADGEGRSIDVNVFRRSGAYAWCPCYYFKYQPAGSGVDKRKGSGLLRRVLRFFWLRFTSLVSLRVSVSSWPWVPFLNLATWRIPADFFCKLEFSNEFGACIPADWEGYLRLRYGEWRVPCHDWVFHRDDGGLLAAAPDHACNRESK